MKGRVATVDEAMRWEIMDPEPNHRFMGLMFERDITPTQNLAVGFVILPEGQEQKKLSIHDQSEEVYIVLQGEAKFILADDQVQVKKGAAVYVAPGCPHRAINTGNDELQIVWVNTPSVFGPIGGYQKVVDGWKKVR